MLVQTIPIINVYIFIQLVKSALSRIVSFHLQMALMVELIMDSLCVSDLKYTFVLNC